MSVMHNWIRFWFKRNDREFEEEAKRQEELAKKSNIPPDILAACARIDQERHQRNQFPVGAFFDLIDEQRRNGQKPSAEHLHMVAEVGKELLYQPIVCSRSRAGRALHAG